MRKNVRILALVAQAAVIVIINILLFAIVSQVNKDRFSVPTFWVAWAFMTFVSLGLSALTFFCTRKKFAESLALPIVYYFTFVIAIVYIIVGLVFTIAPIDSNLWVWVVESIITIANVVLLLYMIFGIKYMDEQRQQVKEKVYYIREAQILVEDCMTMSTNDAVKPMLKKLAEAIRYSDPMSHENVEQYERQLKDIIIEMQSAISLDSNADVAGKVAEATQVLNRRNSMVRISK